MITAADSRHQRGFTLLEMVAVIVILAVAAVPLAGVFSQAGYGALQDEDLQRATQLAQERAEYLMAVRRQLGYNDPAVSTGLVENLSGRYAVYTRTTTLNDPFAGAACPTDAICKQLSVDVSRDGQSLATVAIVLVDY
ncbi:MAG: type II secretion system protein [Thiogranum sp.]|jgi:prepilin-type N-terminal cleavage/methylation domain-containing protein